MAAHANTVFLKLTDCRVACYAQSGSLPTQPGLFLDEDLSVSLNHLGVGFRTEMLSKETLERFTNAVDRGATVLVSW